MIVPYKKILNIINNENINIYIKIKNNIITLGYENEELNNKNSVLYDKNIHHNIVIKYINNITNNINFNNINLLGQMMYCIIKNEYFYKKYYIPLIIKQMKKHNIQFMDIRTIVGTLFKVVNGKKKYISIKEEIKYLSKFKNYFNIIICLSKSMNNKIIIKKINEIYNLNIDFQFIKGIDFIGDENNNNFINIIDELKLLEKKYNINYYIHAGEFTNSINSYNNLKSIHQLNIKRIGHGSLYFINEYNKFYLPFDNKIFIELCPISNYIYHNTIYNTNLIKKYLNYILIGSDDDNRLKSNLTIDYMMLYYYYRLTKEEIIKLLLNYDNNNNNINYKKYFKNI